MLNIKPNSKMINILIVETEYEGHYLTGYIKYILRSFKNQRVKITLLTSIDAKKNANGAFEILRKENVKFNIETLQNVSNQNRSTAQLLINQIRLYFIIKTKFKSLTLLSRFDHIFITSAQKIDKALAFFGSPFGNIAFTVIFLEVKFHLKSYKISHNSRFNYLSKIFFRKVLKIPTLHKIITNDHLLKNYTKEKKWKEYERLQFLHDPKEFNFNFKKNNSRDILGLPKNSILVLVYGALIDSKGINELLSIFKNNTLKKDIRIILAGKHLGQIPNFFKNNNFISDLLSKNKIFIFNSWIDEKKESHIFAATDIVWVGYKNYSSPSGVFYQAMQKSLPVLISNDGLINNLNKKIKVGCPVNIFNSESIIKGIDKILKKTNKKKFIKNIIKFSRISDTKKWVNTFQKMHHKLYI